MKRMRHGVGIHLILALASLLWAPGHAGGDLVVSIPDLGALFVDDLVEYGLPFAGDGSALGHSSALRGLLRRGATAASESGDPTAAFGAFVERAVRQASSERRENVQRSGEDLACEMNTGDVALLRQSLDDWEWLSPRLRQAATSELPWLIFFDERCVWHVNPDIRWPGRLHPGGAKLEFLGEPVPVWSLLHERSIELPNGTSIKPQLMAATFFSRELDRAFFVMAALSIWKGDPIVSADRDLELRLRGVVTHELVHTLHIPGTARVVSELGSRYTLPPDVNELLLQSTFDTVPSFVHAYERERDLFFEAATESDTTRRRALIVEALAVAKERRQAHFRGEFAFYEVLEDEFLVMEGVAEWARFHLLGATINPKASYSERIDFIRGVDNEWAQDEGLALMLVVDQVIPDWPDHLMGSAPISLFDLLRGWATGEDS